MYMASSASVPLLYGRSGGHSPISILRTGSSSSPSCSNSSSSFSPPPSRNSISSLSTTFTPSPSSSTSSDSDSSFDSCNFSGTTHSWKNKRYKSRAMSMALGAASPKGMVDFKVEPDHLLVLVHGILASPSDWTYFEAELKKRLGRSYLIYASSSNTYTKTFSGVDGAGRRLADEVIEVVKKTESLKKISFLSHSLGGLFSRYAVAVLYSADKVADNEPCDVSKSDQFTNHGTIAGLEAINFITLATPHLGVRGRKQLPFLFGVPFLEKLAPPIAQILVGRTGRQLFLTDCKADKPPLLLRMASDCEDGKFLSALAAFKSRILYANVSYDHMVGWRTSSVRRENELPKPPRKFLEGYKHVVHVENCPPCSSTGPHFHSDAVKVKEAAQNAPSTDNMVEYHDIMEEEIICGLQRLEWKKVDVSFRTATWPFFAHNNIHVKNEWFHKEGAGVVAHVVESLKQQETSTCFAARL